MLSPRARTIGAYLLLSYGVALINAFGFLKGLDLSDPVATAFVGAVFLTYGLLYLLPALGLALLCDIVVSRKMFDRPFRATPWARGAIVYGVTMAAFSAVQVMLFADKFIFHRYDFHLNGFVWNLVFTRGGMESLGGSSATAATFALIIAGLVAAQGALLALLLLSPRLRAALERHLAGWRAAGWAAGALALFISQGITHGLCDIRDYRPVLRAADVVPFYQGITFERAARHFGIRGPDRRSVRMKSDVGGLRYPLQPLARRADAPRHNLVILAGESWRWDMLDPEIAPAIWAFSQRATRMEQHYSSGNGTRMAMFGLFYGLYGTYWFPFLKERRGPVLMDIMVDDNYQMELFTSARFTYPEFDRTLFARVPSERLHEVAGGAEWERDRRMVTSALDFIDRRDPARPFMTFLFFESPHADYHFPPECVIRTPYLTDLNYATMNASRDAALIKNRYINSCRHLDTQIERVVKHLDEKGLLDSTIVLITGDHGEEFMEKGRWGHNSTFSEEQIRVPMVLWAPGVSPRVVTRLTSHLDVPGTLLSLLGVTNAPEDYSFGINLLGNQERESTVVANWSQLAYVDAEGKFVVPVSRSISYRQAPTTRHDAPLANGDAFIEHRRARLIQIMNELRKFGR